MQEHVIYRVLNLNGMTCHNCETRIEKALYNIPGILRVKSSYRQSTVEVEFDELKVSMSRIRETIEDLDYQVVESNRRGIDFRGFVGLLVVVIAFYMLIKNTVGSLSPVMELWKLQSSL